MLAYNWPKNVREIDRVAKLMLRFEKVDKYAEFIDVEDDWWYLNRLDFTDHRYAGINIYDFDRVVDWVSSWGGDKFLLSQLKEYGLNPSDGEWEGPFGVFDEDYNIISTISVPDIDGQAKELSESYGVKIIPRIKAFDRAYYGFVTFCGLFGKYDMEDENILRRKNLEDGYIGFFEWHYQNADKIRLLHSEHPNKIPKDLNLFLSRLEKLKDSDKPQDVPVGRNYIDVSEMTEAQLLKKYYEIRLRITGGNVKKAAEQADVPNTTLRDRLDKLGVSFRKEDKNI